MEDEAVVCEILRRTKGCLQLVDTSKEFVNLKRQQGLREWVVLHPETKKPIKYEDVKDEKSKTFRSFTPSVFPPNAKEADSMRIERAMRVLPTFQNTGGFFIAVFEKVKAMSNMEELGEPNVRKADPPNWKLGVKGIKDTVLYFANKDVIQNIREHYNMKSVYPDDQFISRGDNDANISLVSESSRDLIYYDSLAKRPQLKLIMAGVRAFVRENRVNQSAESFRITTGTFIEISKTKPCFELTKSYSSNDLFV